jgi:hypothetical protein
LDVYSEINIYLEAETEYITGDHENGDEGNRESENCLDQ